MTQIDLPPPPGYEVQGQRSPQARFETPAGATQTANSGAANRAMLWYLLLLPYFVQDLAIRLYLMSDDSEPPEWLYDNKTFAVVAGAAVVGVLLLALDRLARRNGG
jgi:hypothetical protein